MEKRVHQTILWHEFGHIFGYIVIDKVFKDYRKISKIILDENEAPQIVPYKENSNSIDNEKIEVIKAVLIFVMGAIFHIAKFKNNDEILMRDFKDIFKNPQDNKKLSTDNLIGHAGSDFYKIKKFIEQSNYIANDQKLIENLKVKKFTYHMFMLFKKHDLFAKLEPYIDDFDHKYNGETIIGDDLCKNERNKIKKAISEKLVKEIKELINQWFSTDI